MGDERRFSYTMKQLREMYREAHDGIGIPGREEWGALIVTSILADAIEARETLEHLDAARPREPAPKALACPVCHFATDVCVHLGERLDRIGGMERCDHAEEGWEEFACTLPKGHDGCHSFTGTVTLRPASPSSDTEGRGSSS
jgi:hypothetical protein